jgi:nuclear protein localization protein 4 homolog
MSFHAYLRQLNAAQQTKAASSTITKQLPPLEEQNYKVRVPCSGGHAPWPEGICTKCQPSAITLQSQVGVFHATRVSNFCLQAGRLT